MTARRICHGLGGLLVVAVGCGGPGRCGVEATVTLDGRPLQAGYLQLIPLDAKAGQSGGGEITEGRFALPARQGLLPGRYRVEVTSLALSKEKIPDPLGSGKLVHVYENCIPARFNTASTLTVDVRRGQANRFELALAAK